jgi:hypothetical protein
MTGRHITIFTTPIVNSKSKLLRKKEKKKERKKERKRTTRTILTVY